MRVLFLTDLFPIKSNPFYGIFNVQRIEALEKIGVQVCIIHIHTYTPKQKHVFPFPKFRKILFHLKETSKAIKFEKLKTRRIFRVKRISLPYRFFWTADVNLLNFFNGNRIKKIINEFEPDLIISSGLHPASTFSKYIKKYSDVQFLSIIEGSDILISPQSYSGIHRIVEIINSFNDKVIFVSKSMKELVTKSYHFKRGIVINNGFDSSIFNYVQKQQRRNDDYNIKLISVGGLGFVKGHDLLLKALVKIGEGFHLKIIGNDDGCREEYLNFINKNKLNVQLLDAMPQADLKKHFDESDFFCMPSRSESFGITTLEAMASGLPVIASNVGGLKDLVIYDFNGVTFESESIEGLVDAIKHVNSKKWNRDEIARWAVKNYSWDKWALQILNIDKN